MECPQCQFPVKAGAKYCGRCGAPLDRLCPRCQTLNPANYHFCHECGAPLDQEAKGTAEQPAPSPASYTPKHLAEKILASRSALEGERKQVTVLFCNLANSTALAERLGPEAMHTLLNRFFELALTEVHRYEGTINQFPVLAHVVQDGTALEQIWRGILRPQRGILSLMRQGRSGVLRWYFLIQQMRTSSLLG